MELLISEIPQKVVPAVKNIRGSERVVIQAGEKVKILAPGEILNEKVPNNKQWEVSIDISIVETSV